MKHELVTKGIWAHVRNSKPPGKGGFAKGFSKGRVLILSGDQEGAIQAIVQSRTQPIPRRYLIPEMPTLHGQNAAVVRGDKACQIYRMCKANTSGYFPLVHPGSKGKGVFVAETSRLAGCNLKYMNPSFRRASTNRRKFKLGPRRASPLTFTVIAHLPFPFLSFHQYI